MFVAAQLHIFHNKGGNPLVTSVEASSSFVFDSSRTFHICHLENSFHHFLAYNIGVYITYVLCTKNPLAWTIGDHPQSRRRIWWMRIRLGSCSHFRWWQRLVWLSAGLKAGADAGHIDQDVVSLLFELVVLAT